MDKYVGDVAYYTCGVKRGKCFGVVSVPAKESFVGRTATLVSSGWSCGHGREDADIEQARTMLVISRSFSAESVSRMSPLITRRPTGLTTSLLVLVVFFIFVVWIGSFFRGVRITQPDENNLLVYALIFLIIGVPVGLPVVTTTTLAVGAAYLARRKAIVQKLTAIESLAGVDMLCSDKTGTLTANKLSLNDPYVAPDVDPNWFMAVAVLASSHKIKSLDPIDKVTIVGLKVGPVQTI